jgi:hypothetical protein
MAIEVSMHRLRWLIVLAGGLLLLPWTSDVAQSQAPNVASGYIVVTLDAIKTETTDAKKSLNLMLAGVAGTNSRLQKITWPTELWQPVTLGEELLSDAREAVPLFALPENQMSDELALSLVVLDNTKADENFLKLSAPRVLEEIAVLTTTWLAGNASVNTQTSALKERLPALLGQSVSLLGMHAIKFSKAQSWGVREQPYEAELQMTSVGKMKLVYSIKRVAPSCQPVSVQARLKQIIVHQNGDEKETGDVYLWARVAPGFAASEELASTILRFPTDKTYALKDGATQEINQVLFEGTVGPFFYLELAAWDDDPAPDADDLLGSFSGLWLPSQLESRPVPVEPKVVPVTARRKTLAGEVTFELELMLSTQPCLSVGTPLHVGERPRGVAVGDFNGDGNLDLAIAHELKDGKVSVFLGDGRGGFHAGATIPRLGDEPNALVAVDLNGDRKLDLIVSVGTQGVLAIMLGQGDGTFGTPSTISVGARISSLAVADFNNDGRLDLAVALRFNNSIAIFLGDGTGRFGSPLTTSVGTQPLALTAGHFNADGKPDLVVANYVEQTVQLLLGQGNGRFTTQALIRPGGQPVSLATGDFNRDGKLDVATTLFDPGLVAVFAGDGEGRLSSPTLIFTGKEPWDVKSFDLNGDGALDLAVTNSADGTLSVLLGDGQGRFGRATSFQIAEKGKRFSPEALAVGDFDKDGTPDLVAANFQTGTVTVLLNKSRYTNLL